MKLVPVWVLVDGDTPVRGGDVRIYAGDVHAGSTAAPVSTRTLRLLNGARKTRTSASGEALLELGRLPHNFTVVVSGGRAGGRTLSGSLSAQVHSYRAEAVVNVNPVSTLVELWRRVDPGVSTRRATLTVHRALGIPASIDDIDLGSGHRWFDANRFLRSSSPGSRGRADIGRETNELLLSIEHGGRTRHFGARRDTAAFATDLTAARDDNGGTIAEWWKQADVGSLITDGLKDLGSGVLKWAAGAAGKWLLGHILEQWGLKDILLPPSDTEVIIQMMKALTEKVAAIHLQVDSVKKALAQSEFNILVGQRDPEVAAINSLWDRLQYVAAIKEKDRYGIELSQKLVSDIGTRLVKPGVADTLNLSLGKPHADGILRAASHVYGAKRFFTHSDSEAIQAVYNYYALTQLRLATLVTEYWTAKPAGKTTCSPPCVKLEIDTINGNIEAQKKQLKPVLPSGMFIDTRSWLMWDSQPQWVSGQRYRECIPQSRRRDNCTPPAQVDPGSDLGTKQQFEGLVEDWEAKGANYASPLAYLESQAGLKMSGFAGAAPNGTPKDHLGHVWLGPKPVAPACGLCGGGLTITRINLVDRGGAQPHIFYNRLHQFDPQHYFAYRMTRHAVAKDKYLWPFG
ncbi:MAG: hypothetical protein ACJ76X_03480 [Solirubrobacteraceae bacterium]